MSYKDITSEDEAFKRYKAPFTLQQMIDAIAFIPADISRGMIGLAVLQIAAYTVNNDDESVPVWLPDFNNNNQDKYTPWHYGGASDGSGSGWSFCGSCSDWSRANAYGGARLAMKDRKRSDHMEKYFSKWYKELYLILTT